MPILLEIVVISLVLLGLGFYQAPFWGWMLGIACIFIATGAGPFFWLAYLLIGAILYLKPLRQVLLVRPMFRYVRRMLPPMSATEREAIEAGGVGWEGELFRGMPNWSVLLKLPKPALTEKEQAFMDNEVRHVCSMLDDWHIVEESCDLSPAVWAYLKEKKFFAAAIPEEYGGLGFSTLAQSTIVTTLATRSGTAAVTTMVPNSLGPGELLVHYGTLEQKNYYLPRLAIGKEVPCFALTGPEAGSDAGAIPDTGIICEGIFEGEKVLGIRLNWNKRYITLAPIATLLGLAFKLFDPDHLIGAEENLGITLCLIPTNLPGVEIGERHAPVGIMFLNGPTRGHDVFVPLSYIIGGLPMAGKGWQMLVECLSTGRGISLPALSAATAQLTYRATGAYTHIRQQFKLPIGRFEGIQAVMGRIAGHAYLIEAMRLFIAGSIDRGDKPSVATAIAKYHMTEMARISVNDAMDIHGGRGIMRGPHNYLAHGYAGTVIAITVEGANILTRNLIIFGQGSIRCHPFLQKEMAAMGDDDQVRGLANFDSLLIQHMASVIGHTARSIVFGLSRAACASSPVNDGFAKYFKRLTWMSSALALVTDVTFLFLGGDLKRKEQLSARLGDVLSNLYLSSAALKYYYDAGAPESDLPMLKWSLETQLYNAQETFYAFFDNFPIKIIGALLKRIVFPLGRAFLPPADALLGTLADHMMKPSAMRDRLSACVYIGGPEEPIGCLEEALAQCMIAEPIERRIRDAVKSGALPSFESHEVGIAQALNLDIITVAEAEILRRYRVVHSEAIRVDAFGKEYFKRKFYAAES